MGKVFINDVITTEYGNRIIEQINSIDDNLEVYIDSPGGDVYKGFAIYNALNRKRDILTTYIDGLAFSALSWAAVVPPPERRFMSPASQFGVHQAWNPSGGNKKELLQKAESLKAIDEIQIEIFETHTNLTRDQIIGYLENESTLSPKQAEAFGFQLYEPQQIAALFNINNNMDLLEKLKNSLQAAKEAPTEEIKEEVKAEIKEEVKASKTPAEALSANFAKKEDLLAYQKQIEPLLVALTDYVKKAPRLEDMEAMAKEATDKAMAALLSQLQSSGEVPSAQEKNFNELEQKATITELKPDKEAFKEIFKSKTTVE